MKRTCLAVAALATTLMASPALAQDNWSWHKVVAAGRTIELKGINGDISAQPASGAEVEVVAHKSARRSDPADVKMQVVEHAGGVTICAVYPTPRFSSHPNECAPGAKAGRMNTRNNDTKVDFEVRVPRGVRFAGRTVNGGVKANGLSGDVVAATVNGSVRVSSTGLVDASTVNGGITARLGRTDWNDDLNFSTVNGSIVVEMPGGLNTEVDASTVNGSMSTDWPLTVSGKWGPKKMHGVIGSGGRSLSLSTVNGDIELRKVQ